MSAAQILPPRPEKVVTPARLTLDVDVPEDWVVDFFLNSDLFSRSYCGYWLRGMVRYRDGSWLAFEHGDDAPPGVVPLAVRRANRAGAELPQGWHRLDRTAAVRAYLEGVKRWGVEWYTGRGEHRADSTSYDVVVQLALLGEVRYG